MIVQIDPIRKGIKHFEFEHQIQELGIEFSNSLQNENQMVRLQVDCELNTWELYTTVRLEAKLIMRCARCLEDYELPVQESFLKVYKFVQQPTPDNDDSEYTELSLKATEFSLRDDIRDILYLAIPMKPLCHEECKGLCIQCGCNLNLTRCSCKRQTDPRLEVFKQFLTSIQGG